MPTKNKFENIVATEEEISKFKLPEPRDYNAKILKLEPKGSSHGLDVLTKEVIELRKELVKANENHKTLEQKIDLEFLKMREFVVNSNKKLLEDIGLLVGKGDGSSFDVQKVREMCNKEACETFSGGLNFNEGFSPCMDPSPHVSREHDAQVMRSNQLEEFQVFTVPVVFADVENSERISSKTDNAAGIAIEQVLSEVAADINGQEVVDVNEVDEKADSNVDNKNTVKDCQKSAHTLDDFIFLDEDLSQINRSEASYLNKKSPVEQNKKKVTPKKRGRKKNSGKLITSPYTPHFESGGTLCVTRQIFPTKHPFSYAIGVDDESDLVNSFTSWLYMDSKKRGKKPYPSVVNVMKPGFELGICTVEAKEWFFKMAHPGQEWSDEHIDVIFYYLRKKGRYEVNNSVRFTTTDCLFKTKIDHPFFQLVHAFENKKNSGIKDSDDIAQYICGRRLLASTPWDKVNYVLFPLNIKEGHHWVFVVFDIVERCLKVYDSFTARGGVNYQVHNIVGMLASVLPYYLSVVKFYDKRPELKTSSKYCGINELERISHEYITNGVPQQRDDSRDCGVYVATFAELVSNGQDIVNEEINPESLRKRFGSLLWEYARRK